MTQPIGEYSATLVAPNPDTISYIDIRPPITPGKEFLGYCGDQYGIDVEHFVTTPNVTRLGVEPRYPSEEESELTLQERVHRTADFIVKTLEVIDEGHDI